MKNLNFDWQPTANLDNLKTRAKILQSMRQFFAKRDVLEVDTPLLSQTTVTDVHLHSMEVTLANNIYYLQTSPEFAMKRLLAAGSGPIYQICKAFRQDELGSLHNPEFTMLEWYRPGFDHHQLMDEIAALLQICLGSKTTTRMTYAEIFQQHLGFNPHDIPAAKLQEYALNLGMQEIAGIDNNDKDIWLQRLLSDYIEPKLGFDAPIFIYDFPASQAALAKIRQDASAVAERFELYIKGIEIANGYHELTDANEQAMRFQNDLAKRRVSGLPLVTYDQRLIAALQQGLPACAGVALGIDRLIMLATHASKLEEVISFTINRA